MKVKYVTCYTSKEVCKSAICMLINTEAMNNFISGARSLYRCNFVMLCGLGRPNSSNWPPSVIPSSRALREVVVGNRLLHPKCYKVVGIRKANRSSHPFYVLNQRKVDPFVHGSECSSVKRKLYKTEASYQKLQPRKRRRLILKTLEVLCVITGMIVWFALIANLLYGNEQKSNKVNDRAILPDEPWLAVRCFKFLGSKYTKKLDAGEYLTLNEVGEVADDFRGKFIAFKEMLDKLKDDKGIQYSLGNCIDLCSFGGFWRMDSDMSWNIDEAERDTKWVASCYIEGSNGIASLNILFERHDTQSTWVATKLHLQKMKESGEAIYNLTSSLPNGLAEFSCLSETKDFVE